MRATIPLLLMLSPFAAAIELASIGRRALVTAAIGTALSPRPAHAGRSAGAEAFQRKRELEKIEQRAASDSLDPDKVIDRALRNELVDVRMLPDCDTMKKISDINNVALTQARKSYVELVGKQDATPLASVREADVVQRRISVQQAALDTEAFSRACSFAE